jgi:hypothetical protein
VDVADAQDELSADAVIHGSSADMLGGKK